MKSLADLQRISELLDRETAAREIILEARRKKASRDRRVSTAVYAFLFLMWGIGIAAIFAAPFLPLVMR